MSARHLCYDKILPHELNRPNRTFMIGNRRQAVFEFRKRWITGSTLSVRFMGGTQPQRELVREQAGWWSDHANLNFDFNDAANARIRIAFDANDGAWSYVGTDALSISLNEPTMNLGFLDRGTVAHEFGHAIGLGHEHQNPDGGIEWNEAQVIADLSGPPNNWTEAQIRHNVLNKYRLDQVKGTRFDGESIMLYEFPADWTVGGQGTQGNEILSALDIDFIKSADAYPGRTSDPVKLDVIETTGQAASIGAPGEEDVFFFDVDNPGLHTIQTDGRTDVVMKLFGPDSNTLFLAEDDDDGVGRNSRIEMDLGPGRYFVQIRHYNRNSGTGDYAVRVNR